MDDEGFPPQRCYFTLIIAGNRRGKSGYISNSGDHEVDKEGHFSSPPLHPGRYCLRFAGILRRPSSSSPGTTTPMMQQRVFDFLYPNALDVADADFFELPIGQSLNNLDVRIPRPIWRTVRGKLTGALPDDMSNIYVHFTRDVGMIDDFGSSGARVDALGAFESPAQPGRYRLRVWEMAPPSQDGYTRMTRELGSTEASVGEHDIDGLEILL